MAGDVDQVTPESASDPTGAAAAARGGAQPAEPGALQPMDQGPAVPAVNPAVNRPTYPVQYGSTVPTGPTPTPEDHLKAESMGSKIYHGVLGALGGTQDVVMTGYDQKTGAPIFSTTPKGPGQQWKQIISGALTGLAGGSGKRGMAAFGGGFQAVQQRQDQQRAEERQQAQQTFENQQKAARNSAEISMLGTQVAKATFDLGRAKVQASAEDTDRMNKFMNMINEGGEGTRFLNHFPTVQAAMDAARLDPTLHDAHAQGQIQFIPHVDTATGQIDGVDAAYVTKEWQDRKIDHDISFKMQRYQDGKMQDVEFTIPKGSYSQGDVMKLMMGQAKDSMDEHRKNITTESEVKLRGGQTAEAYASAQEKRAQAANIGTDETGMSHDALVDAFGRGQLSATQMSRVIAKNPALLRDVMKAYPGFDSGKVDAYIKAEKDFTDGKEGQALNAGGTALVHLYDLMKMNTTSSHIPGMPDYNAYMNQLDTLAGELTRFYGTESVEARKHIIETLGAQLPGNRDAAIKAQIKAMGRKFDSFDQQWRNAAPSAVYQAKMPQVTDEAKLARAAIDPEYAKRPEAQQLLLQGQQQQGPPQQQQAPGQPQPQVQQFNLPNNPNQNQRIVPAGAFAGKDANGNIVGYKDAQGGWHPFY